MSAFVNVVESGSFSAAAKKMATPLATVSRRVAELEQALRVQLMTRSTRKLSLTEIGSQYFETCKRVLKEIESAERMASGEYSAPMGQLTITAPVSFGRLHLSPIIFEFLRAYPEIDVDLKLHDTKTDLFEEEIDVALRIGVLEPTNQIALKVGQIRHITCASPSYLASHQTIERPSDLVGHYCVTFTSLHSSALWTFKDEEQMQRVAVHSRFTVSNAEAAVEAATEDLGLTRVLCYQAAKSVAEGKLSVVLKNYEPEPMPVHFLYPTSRQIPKKLRAFLDFATPRLRKRIVFDA